MSLTDTQKAFAVNGEGKLPIYGSIYRITSLSNKKVYIGLTRDYVSNRWYQHKQAAILNKSSALYQAIRKHGAENFICEQIACAIDANSLSDLETILIRQYEAYGQNGYNMSLGGESGFKRSYTEEGLARIRARSVRPDVVANNSNRNKKRMQTCEGKRHQARMVEAAKLSRDKLSKARKKYANTEDGRKQIIEASKMGAAKRAESSGKPVNVGGLIFRSVQEVANEFKIERAAVRYRIKSARFNDWRWYVS